MSFCKPISNYLCFEEKYNHCTENASLNEEKAPGIALALLKAGLMKNQPFCNAETVAAPETKSKGKKRELAQHIWRATNKQTKH